MTRTIPTPLDSTRGHKTTIGPARFVAAWLDSARESQDQSRWNDRYPSVRRVSRRRRPSDAVLVAEMLNRSGEY